MTDRESAEEAKALVALAFRNGPLEDVHDRISQEEMKGLMKFAVDHVYWLLRLKTNDPELYQAHLAFGNRYTDKWDDPEPVPEGEASLQQMQRINMFGREL